MTLDEALERSQDVIAAAQRMREAAEEADHVLRETDAEMLARFLLDALGEAQGCGMEPPEAFLFRSDGSPGVSFGEDTMSAREARIVAAGFLRAAEKAEQLAAEKAEETR